MNARRWLGLLPPMVAGMAGAIAVEASAGVLLYTADGLLPALTIILTIEVGALGLGIGGAPLPVRGGVVEQLRRRWMFSLIVFALAAGLSAGLSYLEGLSGSGIGQGIGLGFLGGLPLFSVGTVLGAMSRPDEGGRVSFHHVGASAVLGAALGFFLSGTLLLPNAAPYTLYLVCLVILSGGALLQGWVLDGRFLSEILESAQTPYGVVRVEQQVSGRPAREVRLLFEADRLRGAEGRDGAPLRGWERAIVEHWSEMGRGPGSVLFLGGGSGTLLRLVGQRFPETRMEIVERTGELVGLARAHFAGWDGWDRIRVHIGESLDPLLNLDDSFDYVLLDSAVLPSIGRLPFFQNRAWQMLAEALTPNGMLIMGGLRPKASGEVDPFGEIRSRARPWFPEVRTYEAASSDRESLHWREGDGRESLLLLSTSKTVAFPLSLADFRLQPGGGS